VATRGTLSTKENGVERSKSEKEKRLKKIDQVRTGRTILRVLTGFLPDFFLATSFGAMERASQESAMTRKGKREQRDFVTRYVKVEQDGVRGIGPWCEKSKRRRKQRNEKGKRGLPNRHEAVER
jgi:hypothetical protein